jgi:hypothetical protein
MTPMEQNRRRHSRRVPDKFAFVQIEGDEVGKVLNVSEGGLSFNTFGPVPHHGPLYFWLSFNLKDRIEGMGELAWTDFSRKMGGLRFVQLSKSSREQIQEWLCRMPSRQVSEREPVPRGRSNGEPANIGASKSDRAALFVSKARPHGFPTSVDNWDRAANKRDRLDSNIRSQRLPASFDAGDRADSSARSRDFPPPVDNWDRAANNWDRADSNIRSQPFPAPSNAVDPGKSKARSQHFLISLSDGDGEKPGAPSPALPGLEASGGLVPAERYHSVKKRQLVRGVLLGICVSAAVAAVVKYSSYGRPAENKSTAVASAESSPAKNDLQAALPAPPPASTPSTSHAPVGNVFSSDQPNKGMVPKPASSKPLAASYAYSPSRLRISDPKALTRAARTPGQPRLSDPPGAVKKSMTPAQLWAAVQGGNTKAAVVLAEDYIQGEGVPKNCQQARILLLMASEKRSAAAIKRLHELDEDKTTCP